MANEQRAHAHPKLGEWSATAICGNDILSSALYVSGIAIMYSGVYAPIVLAFIGVVLFLYKKVYTEVVEALPVNGGAYNCLLNGTSKTIAAVAGVTTILSYVATAVISALVGIEYVHTVIHSIPVIPVTIGLLFAFALLVISGIKDSAKVALAIFCIHVVTLLVFLAIGLLHAVSGPSYLASNLVKTQSIVSSAGGILMALYLGFSASLLGVSGFESSANFVEEQKPGVFRKTLRNMLAGVAFFNPLIALVVLNSMPYEAIIGAKDFLLADAARTLGGTVFQYLVVIDAFLVLSGAVLTSYVGVSGLVNRMAADACLPGWLAKENNKGSFQRIILAFFVLCSSILVLTKGDLLSLAGVYTIAFLSVMSLFALGNIILKETRTELKRTYQAPLLVVGLAFLATFIGILGNIRLKPQNLTFFELYFIPAVIIVLLVVYQDYVIKSLIRMTRPLMGIHTYLQDHFEDMTDGRFVVFIHNLNRLHKALEYINRNEIGWKVTLVKCRENDPRDKGSSLEEIQEMIPQLKKAGVFEHFDIKVLYVDKPFGPEVIEEVSKKLKIRKNRMMIGSIHNFHEFDYDELGGVRIIF